MFGLDDADVDVDGDDAGDDDEDKKRTSDRLSDVPGVILTNGVGVELRLTIAKIGTIRILIDVRKSKIYDEMLELMNDRTVNDLLMCLIQINKSLMVTKLIEKKKMC